MFFVNIKTVLQNYCTQCLYWLNFFFWVYLNPWSEQFMSFNIRTKDGDLASKINKNPLSEQFMSLNIRFDQ